MPYPGLRHPEPLWQATADQYLCRGHSDTVLAQSLWVGHVFCALPRSEQRRRPGAWQAHCPKWAVPLGGCQPSRPQEDVVSSWEPAHNLAEDAVSGAEILGAPCLPARTALAVSQASLPLGRERLACSWIALLWYLFIALFCEWARLQVRLLGLSLSWETFLLCSWG